jgi:formylglycine-generating enzyme required for sulfatase activity
VPQVTGAEIDRAVSCPLFGSRDFLELTTRDPHFAPIGLAALWAMAAVMSPTARSAPPRQTEDAARSIKPYVETIPGTAVTFEMLPIPGGTFTMGSPMTEEKRSENDGPRHAVRIAPFWMGKCEATWEEYDQFARALDLKKKAREKVDLFTQPESTSRCGFLTRRQPRRRRAATW